jgi:nucleobase:cation symporter-1, NCS1 family
MGGFCPSRYAKSERAQAVGQAIGLPVAMTAIAACSISVTCATKLVWGEAVANPTAVVDRIESPAVKSIGGGGG